MLIRSQNRKRLIDIQGKVIGIEQRSDREFWMYAAGENSGAKLGAYFTEEKAIKVLDMLKKAYAEYEMLRGMSTGMGGIMVTYNTKMIVNELEKEIQEKTIFQMPEDSEVEAND